MSINILIGAVFGCLLIVCFEVIRYILWSRKLDRRFEIELRAKDAARDKVWRELGGASVEISYGTERPPTVLDRFREMLVEALGQKALPQNAG